MLVMVRAFSVYYSLFNVYLVFFTFFKNRQIFVLNPEISFMLAYSTRCCKFYVIYRLNFNVWNIYSFIIFVFQYEEVDFFSIWNLKCIDSTMSSSGWEVQIWNLSFETVFFILKRTCHCCACYACFVKELCCYYFPNFACCQPVTLHIQKESVCNI
jgi:hypothetical protein